MINARNVGTLLDELLTDPTVKKDSWSTVDEALRKAECIRKEDGEAFLPMKARRNDKKGIYRQVGKTSALVVYCFQYSGEFYTMKRIPELIHALFYFMKKC